MGVVDVHSSLDAELSNINAALQDVPAQGSLYGVTLTAAELDALFATAGVFVCKSTTTQQQRQIGGKVIKSGIHPGNANRTR